MKSKKFVSILLSIIFFLSVGPDLFAQIIAKPMILSVMPKKVALGGELTITGNFVGREKDPGKSKVEVKIDSDPVKFVIKKPGAEIVVPMLPDPTTQPIRGEYLRYVVVTVDGNSSNEYPFYQPKEIKPTISLLTPERVTVGDKVTISGNFVSEQTDSKGTHIEVKIDSENVGFNLVEPGKKIEFFVPKIPSVSNKKPEYKRDVVVVVDGKTSNKAEFYQVTWRSILKFPIWLITIIYLLMVGIIFFRKGATPSKKAGQSTQPRGTPSIRKYFKIFRSETGELSLSKSQMILWTFVFSFSYVLLSLIYKQFLDITEGMFWLMGISSATAVGAKAIVLKNQPKPSYPSKLLSDYDEHSHEYRLSLHRCQIALWTLIIVAIYVYKLIDTMHLPDIPTQLLVLMGISGGTYLGFNYPKQ